MFRPTSLAVSLLLVASLGFAPAPVYKERRDSSDDDPKNLQGRWLLVSRTRDGKTPSHSAHVVEIRGNRWTLYNKTGTWSSVFDFTLAVKTSPRQIDMQHDKHKGRSGTIHGIYKVKGDRLDFAFTMDAGPRPTDFRGDSPKAYVDVYRREKP
jgi:uncharacterized protein (TIGR03067 family)